MNIGYLVWVLPWAAFETWYSDYQIGLGPAAAITCLTAHLGQAGKPAELPLEGTVELGSRSHLSYF